LVQEVVGVVGNGTTVDQQADGDGLYLMAAAKMALSIFSFEKVSLGVNRISLTLMKKEGRLSRLPWASQSGALSPSDG